MVSLLPSEASWGHRGRGYWQPRTQICFNPLQNKRGQCRILFWRLWWHPKLRFLNNAIFTKCFKASKLMEMIVFECLDLIQILSRLDDQVWGTLLPLNCFGQVCSLKQVTTIHTSSGRSGCTSQLLTDYFLALYNDEKKNEPKPVSSQRVKKIKSLDQLFWINGKFWFGCQNWKSSSVRMYDWLLL